MTDQRDTDNPAADAPAIRWNDQARDKILADSDRVLAEAVMGLGTDFAGRPWEDSFAELNARLKDRFIDFKPGPDLREYAEAISRGEYRGESAAPAAPAESAAATAEAPAPAAPSTTAPSTAAPSTTAPSAPAAEVDGRDPAAEQEVASSAGGGIGGAGQPDGDATEDQSRGNGAPGRALADTSDADPAVNDG